MILKTKYLMRSIFLLSVLAAVPAAANEQITFKDHYDTDVILNGIANRVVAIPKPAPAMFMAVDGSSEIIQLPPV